MAQYPLTHGQGRQNSALSSLLLLMLLVIYGAGMLVLPVYFFGLYIGLWLSGALLAGGFGVAVALAGANRKQEPPLDSRREPCVAKTAPSPEKTWVRPRIITYH